MEKEREALLRDYATGDMTWRGLQQKGIDNYFDVLAGLGELGLRPPVAPMEGANVELRQRRIAMLRASLKTAQP